MRKTVLLLALLLLPSLVMAQGTLKVSSVYGPVEWKATSASQFSPLAASTQLVHVGDQIHTGIGGSLVLELADGSYMVVSENSTLTVQEFWASSSLRDLVNITLGKVRFYIQRFGGKPNPYRVGTSTALISVRGTTFEVSVDEAKITEVRCLEGSVAVENPNLPDREVILQDDRKTMVRPGEYPTTPVGNEEELSKNRVVVIEHRGPQDTGTGKGGNSIDTLLHDNDRNNQPVSPLQAPGGVNGNGTDANRSKPTLRYPR